MESRREKVLKRNKRKSEVGTIVNENAKEMEMKRRVNIIQERKILTPGRRKRRN